VIPGAFAGPVAPYQAHLDADRLVLVDPAGAVRKAFTLLEDGFRVEISTAEQAAARLPLVVDAWQRFNPGWASRYTAGQSENGVSWGIPGELVVQVESAAPLQISTFMDTRQWMGRLEDPNRDYPPGHYLPFPLALVELAGSDIQLEIKTVE
jgi:hypothetical protein